MNFQWPDELGPFTVKGQGTYIWHICVGPGAHSLIASPSDHGGASLALTRTDGGQEVLPTFSASPPNPTMVAFSLTGEAIMDCTLLYTQTFLSTVHGICHLVSLDVMANANLYEAYK